MCWYTWQRIAKLLYQNNTMQALAVAACHGCDLIQQVGHHQRLSFPALLQAEIRRLSGRARHRYHGLHSIGAVPHAAGLQEAHRYDRSAACTPACVLHTPHLSHNKHACPAQPPLQQRADCGVTPLTLRLHLPPGQWCQGIVCSQSLVEPHAQ